MNISILDCTLRDGGYINNWNFPRKSVKYIFDSLNKSKIEYIELGYFQTQNLSGTIFNDLHKFDKDIINGSSKYLAMVDVGQVKPENIPVYSGGSITGLRVVFYKRQISEALKLSKEIIDKGYELFLQPMVSIDYTKMEFTKLLRNLNFTPYGVSIVDSFGSMTESKSVEMFDLVYQNTADGCAIGFHSHNNTQRSLLNVSRIIHHAESNYLNREIIIDSSLAGMGRGAGNLQTEVLSAYLNGINKACNYNVEELTIASGEHVEPLKSQGEWGYNAMHALTAMKKCHPNFAKYAIQLNPSMSMAEFAEFLNKIPNEYKSKCTLKITEKILNMKNVI